MQAMLNIIIHVQIFSRNFEKYCTNSSDPFQNLALDDGYRTEFNGLPIDAGKVTGNPKWDKN